MTSKGTLLVTDLKSDTNEIYGKDTAQDATTKRLITGLSLTDSTFIRNYSHLRDEVQRKADEFAELAAREGVSLAKDDPFALILDGNSKFNIAMPDLALVQVEAHPKETEYQSLLRLNLSQVSVFIDFLDSTKNNLLKVDPFHSIDREDSY